MTARREDSPFNNLCQYRFSDGRMCSMPGKPSLNGYCQSHAALNRRKPPVEEDLSTELSQFYSPDDGRLDVHRALERVFKAMAANRITTRRAAAFGYLGQLILLSRPGRESEQLDKRELHDMYNIMGGLLRANFGPNGRRSAQPRPAPAQPSKPVSTSPTNQNPRRTQ